ncbi:FAD-dependent monooxygenase [Neoaquamicrobium sediminum]|uniref:FAD-dependent monooxygenase n=1 Tax=Neoaquamicrobium sediminum TaxID=1849104 RepID=UPI0035E446F7
MPTRHSDCCAAPSSPSAPARSARIISASTFPTAACCCALDEAVSASKSVERAETTVSRWNIDADSIEAELADGRTVSARLAVAADGRMSPAREAAGIAVSAGSTGQSALVLDFAHARPHNDTSTEFHTEDGPFTLVPLSGQRSSLVWVTRPHRAEELVRLSDDELSLIVEERMQSMLGRVTVEPGRQVFPLSSALPRRFAANRVALVGEAAHIFPPIGAQGLNLGIRDVESLLDTAMRHSDDPGSPAALSAYDRRRRPDILARSSAVNMLNRSLLSDMLPVQLMRTAGLSLLGAAPPLRALFMREGLRTGSGFGSVFRV